MRSRLFAVVLVLRAATAVAQTAPQLGEQHFRIGADAFGRHDYNVAAIEFRTAFELTHEPALLFNLGTALLAQGRRDEARDAFEQYLRMLPAAPNRAAVEVRLRDLRSTPVVTAASATVTPPVVVTPVSIRPPAPSSAGARTAGVVIGGIGLVALGVGVGLYVDVDGQFGACAVSRCAADQQPRSEDAASVALLWGGGVVAAAGMLTWLLSPRGSRTAPPRALVVPSAHGVAVGGVF